MDSPANGMIYVPTYDGTVDVYGLTPGMQEKAPAALALCIPAKSLT
jgi:hypothetical protein